MQELEVDPEYQKLYKKIGELSNIVTELIEDRDHILYHENPRIAAEYITVLGRLQLEVYEMQNLVLRLKRKIEIYQMLINRQEEIDEQKIELILEKEYKEYSEKINELEKQIKNASKFTLDILMSAEDAIEFKKIYRDLILRLHPDIAIHKNETEEEKKQREKLLQQVMIAYENGDLNTLRSLLIIVESRNIKNAAVEHSAMETLLAKKEHLETTIVAIKEQIEQIKNSYPNNLLELLSDDELIKLKQEEYMEALKSYQEVKENLEVIFNNILEKLNGGKNV